MSRTSVPPPTDPRHDPEAIALRVHQIAAAAAVLAEAAVSEVDGEVLSHALYLMEACLLDLEERVEELRHV